MNHKSFIYKVFYIFIAIPVVNASIQKSVLKEKLPGKAQPELLTILIDLKY